MEKSDTAPANDILDHWMRTNCRTHRSALYICLQEYDMILTDENQYNNISVRFYKQINYLTMRSCLSWPSLRYSSSNVIFEAP